MRPELSHHPRCPAPWDDCECAALWLAAERDAADELERAYGEFYDPDWTYEPATYAVDWGRFDWRSA